ncbi:MAG: hypothetical protein ACT4P8_07410 [Betaproteobacteria bacterium]
MLPPLKRGTMQNTVSLSGLAVMPRALIGLLAALAMTSVWGQGFRFSNEDTSNKEREAERQAKVQSMLATPCRDKIRNQKIMVLVGEERNGVVHASQSAYSPHVDAINGRLKSLGLRTYSPEEIRSQIAQAEIDAYFKNDPDAAISASKRLAAQYILRGLIATQATRNPIVNVNQVSVSMNFTLTGANGRMISQADARNESYAGRDTRGMALTLINERADEVVAQLYSDYCQRAR